MCIRDSFWDETFNHSVHPEISAESKMIAFQCMIDAAKQELPLTLEDLKQMEGLRRIGDGLFVGCDGSQGRIVGTETGFQYG